MTYIIGWKNKTSVFIHADSLVTESVQGKSAEIIPKTSFGEKPFIGKDFKVEKEVLKVFNLHGKIGVSFAGWESVGRDVVTNFKHLTSVNLNLTYESIVELLKLAIQSVSPNDNKIQLVIGFVDCNNEPVLMTYNHKRDKMITKHDFFVSIGVTMSQISVLCERFCSHIISHKYNDRISLVSVNSFLQNLGLVNYLPQFSFGGFFIGIRVDSNGTHWLENISYFLYSSRYYVPHPPPPADDSRLILVRMKFLDNVLLIKSKFFGNRDLTAYLDPINADYKRWVSLHSKADARNHMNKMDQDDFSFICIERLSMGILPSEVNKNGKYVSWTPIDKKTAQFNIEPAFVNALTPMTHLRTSAGKLVKIDLRFSILYEKLGGFIFTSGKDALTAKYLYVVPP